MTKVIDVIPRVIYVPARELVRMGRERWIVYLPKDYNDLWQEIKTKGYKVKLYLVIEEQSSRCSCSPSRIGRGDPHE